MAIHATAFISTAVLKPFLGTHISLTSSHCKRCKTVLKHQNRVRVLQMRTDRGKNYYRPPDSTRRRPRHNSPLPSIFFQASRRAKDFWYEATPSERFMFGLAGLSLVAAVGVAINVVFHVSLMLAFGIIPLILAPIFLTVLASTIAFGVAAFALSAGGLFFIGTPIMAFGFLAKVMFPLAAMAGGAVFLSRMLLFGKKEAVLETEETEEDEWPSPESEFEEFDEKLRVGDRYSPVARDVTLWNLSDVVDELDYKGLGEYRQLFIEEKIDGPTLLTLTDADIKSEFGASMPLGDRMRLSRLVLDLKRRSGKLQ